MVQIYHWQMGKLHFLVRLRLIFVQEKVVIVGKEVPVSSTKGKFHLLGFYIGLNTLESFTIVFRPKPPWISKVARRWRPGFGYWFPHWPADEEALNKGYLNRRAASLQLMWVWSCWCAIQAHSEERIVWLKSNRISLNQI